MSTLGSKQNYQLRSFLRSWFTKALLVLVYLLRTFHVTIKVAAPEMSQRVCVLIEFLHHFPVERECTLDSSGFPSSVNLSSWRRLDLSGTNKYSMSVFRFTSKNSAHLPAVLQHMSLISESIAILLNRADGLRFFSTNSTDVTSHSFVSYSVGTRQWWDYTLNSVGLHVVHVTRHDMSKVLLKVHGGLHLDPCQCAKSLEHTKEIEQSRKHASCAVVMNSGLLGDTDGPTFGPVIDTYEAVFRMNAAPSGGVYAGIAGSKTTYRLTWPHNAVLKTFGDELMLFSVYYSKERRILKEAIKMHKFRTFRQPVELPKAFMTCAKGCMKLPERHTSTGILAVVLAVTLCDRVTVFGKSLKFDSMNTSRFPYYYFEDNVPEKVQQDYFWPLHRPDLEHKFYEHLHTVGVAFIP